MKRNNIPENIGEYVKYDETSSTGLRWIKKTNKFSNINVYNEAGCLHHTGYYYTQIKKKVCQNHRIIFFLHYGYYPMCVDHIDNNPLNNKINNLREATFSENSHNSKIPKTNTTGVKGVGQKIIKGREYWRLSIRKNNKKVVDKLYRKDEFTLEQVKEIIKQKRLQLHDIFSNHG